MGNVKNSRPESRVKINKNVWLEAFYRKRIPKKYGLLRFSYSSFPEDLALCSLNFSITIHTTGPSRRLTLYCSKRKDILSQSKMAKAQNVFNKFSFRHIEINHLQTSNY